MCKSRLKILLAEDQVVFSDGLSMLLKADTNYQFLGTHVNGKELLNSESWKLADIILMDINMPILNGIEACKQLLDMDASKKVIMLSMYGSQELLIDAINAGAKGYLLKNTSKQEIDLAIQLVDEGQVYFSSKLISESMAQKPYHKVNKNSSTTILTRREKQILKLLSVKSPSSISVELGLNLHLVYVYIKNLYKKFNVNDTKELLLAIPS